MNNLACNAATTPILIELELKYVSLIFLMSTNRRQAMQLKNKFEIASSVDVGKIPAEGSASVFVAFL